MVAFSPELAVQIDSLRAPGKNRWLTVLYLLMVWREWIGGGNTEYWDAAVADVRWVTIQLCDAIYYNPRAVLTGTKRYVTVICSANSFC